MITDLMLAELAAETYRPGVCQALPHSKGVVHFTIRRWYGSTVIGIQGTKSRAQIIADLRFWPRPSPDGWWAHRGFLSAAAELHRHLKEHWAEYPAPYVITGHSLGAAVALVLAGLLRRDNLPQDIRMVGFGCPRAGMSGLRSALADVDVTLYRFGNDPIPTVPWPFPWAYRHVRPWIQIGSFCLDPFEAHHVEGYCETLKDIHSARPNLRLVRVT